MNRTRGFTILEMLVSLVLISIVLAGALSMFRSVSGAVNSAVDRMDAMQNLRYALGSLDREVRSAGAGTTEIQPTLVYINSSVVVFNGDMVSRTPNSPTAVYYNPDVALGTTMAALTSAKFYLPGTTIQYPDTTYRSGGALSPAETVMFWFTGDTSTSRGDDYVLMRQVNNTTPDIIARNLLVYPGRPFFEWLRTDSAGNLQLVPTTAMPMRHANPIHGALSDTSLGNPGAKQLNIDSIRAVRVNAYATNGQTGSREVRRALVTTVRIPNSGLTKQRSCGDSPIFNGSVSVSFTGTPEAPQVTVTWSPAVDETTGETDVERYLIYRRTVAGSFSDALQSVPAGQSSYTYDDASVENDSAYVYGVSALDCTPLESSLRSSSSIPIPPLPPLP